MKNPSNMKKAMRVLRALSGLALLAAIGSGTRCATTALSSRNTGGSVKVFELGQRIPRNSKIIDIIDTDGPLSPGVLTIDRTDWIHCRYKPIIRYIKRRAKALGGDAIAILYNRKPYMWNSCFMIKAFLLDLIDISDWPRIGLTEEEIRREMEAGERTLDDIEGIWTSNAGIKVMMDDAALREAEVFEYSLKKGATKATLVRRVPPSVIRAMEQLSPEEQISFQIAIVKAAGDPDYPYAAYILDPDIPEWKPGFLKAWLRKLPDSTGYEAKWYGSTFQADLREFHPDETGALTTKVVIEQGLKYSIEQTLTKVYHPQR